MDELNPRSLTRQQLARFLPSHELVKAFEALFSLAGATPDAINTLTQLVEEAKDGADSARSSASSVAGIATLALSIAQDLNEGPPVVPIQAGDQPEDITHLIHALRAEIDALTQRISALEERPTP
jgi:DNA-binding transcriptional LysR family regulator